MTETATIYRTLSCPHGMKAKHLLRRKGYHVEDRHLTARPQVDAFKAEHGVATVPQVFIGGARIGGNDDLRRHFGLRPANRYRPVTALFAMTALMALAASHAAFGSALTIRTAEWFVAFSMVALALLKLQNLDGFATMFLNYDLLARRWVPYAYVYPFAEGLAGVLMIAGVLTWLSAPLALFIGMIGAVSVLKAVYIDRRDLKCACVGGSSTVPLGFLSLTENVMMVAMAVWMLASPAMAQHAHHDTMQGYMTPMDDMMTAMGGIPSTGDADADFLAMMIPHHQSAIDMARVLLEQGDDPETRALAQKIIDAQESEIARMQAMLDRLR